MKRTTLFLLFPLLMLAVACEKVPLTSPTGSTIVLSIDKAAVPIGGTAILTAVVTEASGTAPQNGTMVTFSAAFGTVTPQEAPTVGGIARATYTGTASGTAKVGAFSGSAKATEVELKVGGAAAERVTVRTEPATIPQAGGTVTVIANVQDISGGVLPSTPVNFTTDNGTLSSNSGVTDANGEARVTLTTTRATKVSANVGTKTADFTVAVLLAPAVTVTGCTATPFVGVAVTCTVTPTVPSGGSPIASVIINWGEGGDRSLGSITGATPTNFTYTAPGNYTVTATAIDQNGQRGQGSASLAVTRSTPGGTLTVPATGTAGVAVAMSYAPPASPPVPITNVTITFGDGGSRDLGAPTGTQGFTRTYSEGAYTVTATITDAGGSQGRLTQSIVVSRAAAATVTLTHTSSPAAVNTPESFTVSAAPATGGPAVTNIRVTLGDGTELYNSASNGAFAHTFTASGNYTLTARATDAAGNVGTSILIVNVP